MEFDVVIVGAGPAGDWLEYRRRAVQQVETARIAAGLSPHAEDLSLRNAI